MDLSHASRSWGEAVETGFRAEWPAAALKAAKWTFPGFGPMTRVDTISGAFPAQTLRVGDRVRTRNGSFAEIRWLDRILLDEDFLHRHPEAQPIVIPARSLGRGLPLHDVTLSPGQRISCEGLLLPHASRTAGDLEKAHAARRKSETIFTYTMFLCARPVAVKVEGLWVELEPPRW